MKRSWLVILCLLLLLIPLTLSSSLSLATDESGDDPLLSFSVMSDTHVRPYLDPISRLSAKKFRLALRDIRRENPDFLVINGDLTEGGPDDFQLLHSTYQKNAYFPLYATMGNHEYYNQLYNKDWNDERAQEQFRNAFHLDRLYYDRFENGVHLIFLSSEIYKAKHDEIGEGAWLSDEQIKWFEETLLASKAPTFVFLHQPLGNTISPYQGVSVAQTEQLKKIARKHPQVIWFSGHTHTDAESPTQILKQDGILYVGSSSVFAPYDISEQPLPGYQQRGNYYIKPKNYEKSQSRFVDVYRDRIVIRTRNHHLEDWSAKQHVEPIRTPFATP